MKTVLKILAAMAAIAGVIYVVATYGDKIVAWCKKVLGGCKCGKCECTDCECEAEAAEEAAPVEEAPVEEVVVEAGEPVAEEADFEA